MPTIKQLLYQRDVALRALLELGGCEFTPEGCDSLATASARVRRLAFDTLACMFPKLDGVDAGLTRPNASRHVNEELGVELLIQADGGYVSYVMSPTWGSLESKLPDKQAITEWVNGVLDGQRRSKGGAQ